MNKLTNLTWKYFYEQKKEEIMEHITGIGVGSILIALVCILLGIELSETFNGYFIWLNYIGISILTFWILVGIFFVVRCFFRWIISNWKEAKWRAVKDIK